MTEMIILTDNGRKVLKYMQQNDMVLVGKDLIELTGVRGIYPVLNSLIKKSLIENAEPITRNFTNSNGETKPKEYKTYRLTDKGRLFVIK